MSKKTKNISSILGFLAGVLVVMAFVGFVLARDRQPRASAPPVAQQQQQPAAADESSVPRISVADAQKKLAAGVAVMIDVRDIDGYLNAHIPGSMHIPLARIDGEVAYLPRDKQIITYCTCPAEESSAQAGLILRTHGFDASCLVGGLGAWTAASLPTHSGEQP
jgi:rhodanese-related sulfurtransferase